MKILKCLLYFIDLSGKFAGGISVLLISGIAVLILSEVFSRWLFGISLSFAWEFSAYFLAVCIFCGTAYTMRTGGHVRVALFSSFIGPRANRIMDAVATLAGTGVVCFLALSMLRFAWRSFIHGSVSPTVDETPLAIPQFAVAFGLVLFALQMIARTIRLFLGEAVEDQAAKEAFTVE